MFSASPSSASVSLGATSPSLIERIKANDTEAWQRLVDLYAPLVYGWCRRAGLSAADSADLMQEVFRSVFTAIASFRREKAGDSFRGWLRTICRNKVNDHFRNHANRPAAAGGTEAHQRLLAIADEQQEPAQQLAEVSGLLQRCMDRIRVEFEPRTWQAFWLVAVENRASADVAAELSMSPGAVRQAKYAVLRRFRDELGEGV